MLRRSVSAEKKRCSD